VDGERPEPVPYDRVSEHLRDELRRAWLRVEFKIRAGWARTADRPSDTSVDIHWTPEVVGQLFKAADDAYHGRRTLQADTGARAAFERWVEHDRAVDARILNSTRSHARRSSSRRCSETRSYGAGSGRSPSTGRLYG